MSRPGLGVMIHMLCGRQEDESITPFIGKKIAAIRLDKAVAPEGALFLTFDDGETAKISDHGRSCCEHRYMHSDDDLGDFVGATLLGTETREGPTKDEELGDCHEMQFLVVATSLGEFTIETHNEHNGYYGGFWMVVERVD